MKYRGQECTSRAFSDGRGTGVEWLRDGKVVIVEHATLPPPTPEQIAAAAAIAAKAAEVAAEKAALAKVVDDLKTGKVTFGDAKRDEAILALAKVQVRAVSAAAFAADKPTEVKP